MLKYLLLNWIYFTLHALKIIEHIEFEFGNVKLLENLIIKIVLYENSTIGLEESRELNNAIGKLCNYTQALILIIAENGTQINNEARIFSASQEGLKYTIADAFVVDNLAHKLIANFYLKINKPAKPSKLFSNEQDAIVWLISHKK